MSYIYIVKLITWIHNYKESDLGDLGQKNGRYYQQLRQHAN